LLVFSAGKGDCASRFLFAAANTASSSVAGAVRSKRFSASRREVSAKLPAQHSSSSPSVMVRRSRGMRRISASTRERKVESMLSSSARLVDVRWETSRS
jgi:hypothetical protein